MPKTDVRREAALRIVETSRLLRSLVEQRLRPYGMTRAQLSTLGRLDQQDGLVQNELAEILEIQPIGMVRLIDQLSAEGLIERRPDAADRRCNRLHITEAGRARVASLAAFKEELGASVFDGIDSADLSHLLSTLNHLHQNIKQIQAADAAARIPKAGAR